MNENHVEQNIPPDSATISKGVTFYTKCQLHIKCMFVEKGVKAERALIWLRGREI